MIPRSGFNTSISTGSVRSFVAPGTSGIASWVSTEEVLGEWSRLHLRGIFSYLHTNWAAFEGGIAGYYTFADNLTDLFEIRTWQGAILFWPVTKLAGRELDLSPPVPPRTALDSSGRYWREGFRLPIPLSPGDLHPTQPNRHRGEDLVRAADG